MSAARRRRGPREQREIAEPPGRQPDADEERKQKNAPKTTASTTAPLSGRDQAGQWLQPSAAIRIGSGAR